MTTREIIRLGDYIEVKTGKLNANAAVEDGLYPFFTCAKEISRIDRYSFDSESILIAGNGDLNVKYYKGKFDAYQRTYVVTVIDKSVLTTRFLHYFFDKYIEELRNQSIGGIIKYIKLNYLTDIKITIPPLPIQNNIVAELDALNDIINIKKQQLEELDKLAEATFYDMFGDPVENEKGWEVKKLGDNVNEMHLGPFGSSLKKEFFVSEDKAYCMVYEQKHAIRKTLNLETRFVEENKYKELKRFEVKPGDFLMSCRGTIGEIFRLPKDAPKGIIHPSLMKIRIQEEKYNPIFFEKIFYTIVKNEDVQGAAVKMAITAKSLGAKELIIPPLSLQTQFAKKIEHIENQKSLIQGSIDDVQQLLDYTMDKYFS